MVLIEWDPDLHLGNGRRLRRDPVLDSISETMGGAGGCTGVFSGW
jgi:hypothetical protein